MLNADVIATRSGSRIPALPAIGGRVWMRVRSLLVAAAQAHVARRAERILLEMPDYLLKDMGISRSTIRRAVTEGRPETASPAGGLDLVEAAG